MFNATPIEFYVNVTFVLLRQFDGNYTRQIVQRIFAMVFRCTVCTIATPLAKKIVNLTENV